MDCLEESTVDFCSEPECLNLPGKFADLAVSHRPNHRVLKIHRLLFTRDVGRTEWKAKEALMEAWEALSDLNAQGREMPSCAHCKEAVSQPCWYCVDCTGEFLDVTTVLVITSVKVCPRRGEIHL